MPSSPTLAGFHSSFAKSSISAGFKSTRAGVSKIRALSSDEPGSSEPLLGKSSEEKQAVEKSSRKKPSGTGFGDFQSISSKKKSESSSSSSSASSTSTSSSSGIRRRPAPTGPIVAPQSDPKSQQLETTIEISLLVLVGVLIVEGLALAASGFLPQEWDDFLVKVVYPSFTPTIGLFVAAAAGYGVYKYFGSQSRS